MTTTDTRQRLLDAAERLFAENGLDGTSLRAITTEADANLAAVNYHFQSKEGLITAVFERRIGPLNRERGRLLDLAVQKAAPQPPALEDVIRAFIAPPLRLRDQGGGGGESIACLIGRMFSEPSEIKMLVIGQFRQTAERFIAVLQQVLPDLPRAELLWRLHFLVGGMAHTSAAGDLIRVFSQGACDPDDAEGTIERLVAFAAAGFCAPMPQNLPSASEHNPMERL
jgi:AcrR family transcriptional regulator